MTDTQGYIVKTNDNVYGVSYMFETNLLPQLALGLDTFCNGGLLQMNLIASYGSGASVGPVVYA